MSAFLAFALRGGSAAAQGSNLRAGAAAAADRQLQQSSLPPTPSGFTVRKGACRKNADGTGKGRNLLDYFRVNASTIDECVSFFEGNKGGFDAFSFKAFEFSQEDKSCELWRKNPRGVASQDGIGCYIPLFDTVHDLREQDASLPIVRSKALGAGFCYDSSGPENNFPESDAYSFTFLSSQITTLDEAVLECLKFPSSEFLVGIDFNPDTSESSFCLYTFDMPAEAIFSELRRDDGFEGVGLPVATFADTAIIDSANDYNCKKLIVEGGFFDK